MIYRLSAFVVLFPQWYVENDPEFYRKFSFDYWSKHHYHYDEDDWGGLKDIAQRPRDTIESGSGDCEDYALVAASWAISTSRENVGIGYCFHTDGLYPTHVIAYDDERLYSSGVIFEKSVEEYIEDSEYEGCWKRPL